MAVGMVEALAVGGSCSGTAVALMGLEVGGGLSWWCWWCRSDNGGGWWCRVVKGCCGCWSVVDGVKTGGGEEDGGGDGGKVGGVS